MKGKHINDAVPGDENKRGKKRIALRVGAIILTVVLLLVIGIAITTKHYLGRIDRYGAEDDYTMSEEEIRLMEEEILRQEQEEAQKNQTEATVEQTTEPQQTQETTIPPTEETSAPTEETTVPEETIDLSEVKPVEGDIVNILLIGQDHRTGDNRTKSDSMILCTINKAKNTVTLTSFLRDLYVQIPERGNNRLNAAYPIGGMWLLNETLKANFGVEVDANVEVDFGGFEAVVDALGGVDVEITKAEADHLEEFYEDVHLVPGMNHLNGEAALAYSRIRYIDSDFERSNRQRNVLSALLDGIRDANLVKLLKLMDAVLPLIKTDMTDQEILSYAVSFYPMLSDCKIITQRIPQDDAFEFARVDGRSVLTFYPNRTREYLEATLK